MKGFDQQIFFGAHFVKPELLMLTQGKKVKKKLLWLFVCLKLGSSARKNVHLVDLVTTLASLEIYLADLCLEIFGT